MTHLIDYAGIEVPEGREYPLLPAKEIELAIRTVLNHRAVRRSAGTDSVGDTALRMTADHR